MYTRHIHTHKSGHTQSESERDNTEKETEIEREKIKKEKEKVRELSVLRRGFLGMLTVYCLDKTFILKVFHQWSKFIVKIMPCTGGDLFLLLIINHKIIYIMADFSRNSRNGNLIQSLNRYCKSSC